VQIFYRALYGSDVDLMRFPRQRAAMFGWTMRNLTLALALVALVPPGIYAQTIPGSDVITGRVTDLTGHPIANARIGVTSASTGKTRSQSTDDNGRYRIYFPETAPNYKLLAKRMGFSPVQRTITRKSEGPEEMRVDLQFGGTPLALSDVEIEGGSDAPTPSEAEKALPRDVTVPNPVLDILALKDTLHLSAVQVVGLNDLADSLQSKNTRIYHDIRALLAKSQAAGDVTQMTGSVTLMLEEASRNTTHAVVLALKLLRQEQFVVLPADIRDRSESAEAATKQ
jgi:hypothetical protein